MMLGRSSLPAFALYFVCIFGHYYSHLSQAQNQTQATTDPNEVRALNSIFRQWGISANQKLWNISGEPCSGAAIDATALDEGAYNPFIKCDCTFSSNTVCHITQLKVLALNVVGVIPDELWTLTFFFNLNLGQNYLTGRLSSSIGNLTDMKYLNFGANALSGELPKELGMLSELQTLSINQNNFSGPLPSELGNLSKLRELYTNSAGVSGEIPSSFANLQSLQKWWASDTELTGRIPDFIGNWSNLTTLWFQGNSFDGPIPSSFSNLTSLKELRISDLSNGSSSSLAFIRDMKSLNILELRNNDISDSIPSNIGEYQSLWYLDLSFNNIGGEIPYSLFNMNSLTHLFLGNNKFNGTLPELKSSSLQNIDVSYNNLVGSLPSWINDQQNLQINLVANNFELESSDISGLPHGLNCLQRNFPCHRGSGIYANFSINCGGPQITSSNGIMYELDNENLGPATYYVTRTNKWGISNVGYFTGSNSAPRYTRSNFSHFTDTLDSRLIHTSRISASSLRYYGLGLENGNYTVNLQFAEIVISNTTTWESLGRRVFDIYVQGNRVLKDFDIKRAAGGFSKKAVQREFKARVSENYLEIHFFWAGKGTCCIPDQSTYGPSISAISVTPDFAPTVSPQSRKKSRTVLIVGIVVGVGVVSFLSVLAIFGFARRRKRRQAADDEGKTINYELSELRGMDAGPYTFSYAELKIATENFSPANKLGEGGFGPVFRGKLGDGSLIAVKQLSVASRQGKCQFVAEVATTSAVQHRNLVKLRGCCVEGPERLLVYEYLEKKSLDQALFGERSLNLDWPTRYDICVGVAKGLAYLHEDSRLRIIHRDVKASNVLLDADLVPKISDFGLAKLYDDKKTHISTRVAGTIGYLAPEYAMRGHLTEKTDIFAFGVMALEVVSGRPNSDPSLDEEKIYLLEWAWELHESNRQIELVDSKLLEFSEEEIRRLIGVALLCTQSLPKLRPSMSRVVTMLSGDMEVSRVTSKPAYLTGWKFDDITSFISDQATKGNDPGNYTSSSSTSMGAEAQHLSGNENSAFAENTHKPVAIKTGK